MIGTQAEAELILSHHLNGDDTYLLSTLGSNRVVYRINNVVYKVQSVCEWDYDANLAEFEVITGADSLPGTARFPKVSLFEVHSTNIIAMEYIEGLAVAECYCTQDEECEDDCMPRDIVALMEDMMLDAGGFNVIVNDDGAWIIDAA